MNKLKLPHRICLATILLGLALDLSCSNDESNPVTAPPAGGIGLRKV